MSEGFTTIQDGLKKLETIVRVQRESLEKLRGATEIEFVIDNLLSSQIETSKAIEVIIVVLQKLTT